MGTKRFKGIPEEIRELTVRINRLKREQKNIANASLKESKYWWIDSETFFEIIEKRDDGILELRMFYIDDASVTIDIRYKESFNNHFEPITEEKFLELRDEVMYRFVSAEPRRRI